MNIFNCSLYEINQGEKMRIQSEGLLLPAKTKHIRRKLNKDKVEHFLEFVFNSGLLEDVAYGTHNIKFDSDLKLKVANTVLTTKYTHGITFYLKKCANYEPLSTSNLFPILRAVKPSQRKPFGMYLYTFIVFSKGTNFALPLVDSLDINI